MKKKIISVAIILSYMFILVGCTSTRSILSYIVEIAGNMSYIRDSYKKYAAVKVIGPNNISDSSFFRIVKNEDEYPHGAIAKMDVETALDTIIFEPTDDRNLSDIVECERGVLFTLTRSDAVNKYSLEYLGEDNELKMILECDRQITIEKVDDRVFVCGTDTYIYDEDTQELASADIDKIVSEAFTADYYTVSGIYYTMEDGTKVTIRKTFYEDDFTYEVDDVELPIECISGEEFKYAQWGNVSDEGGVLYGIVAIPKYNINYRMMKVGLGGLATEDVTKELLFSLDVSGGNSKVLFETKGERIIGYTDKEVYLYRNDSVYKRNLDSGKEEEIGTIPDKSIDRLAFRWIGTKLFVFDEFKGTFITSIQG